MGDLLLSTESILMCPHGGRVHHVSSTGTTYRIAGRPPMLLGDTYTVSGCPFFVGRPSPCVSVHWLTASTKLVVRGRPILTDASVGICNTAGGVQQGPVLITTTQLGLREPDDYTSINE